MSQDQSSNERLGITPDSIIIGSSNALSGHASFLGTQYSIGSQAWFNEINAAGGIHGRQIHVISYDDQYDPPLTVENTARLINEDQVFMLFNYVGTPTSVQIIETVHENQIPAFGFLTGAEALRTPFRPFMFHARASYYAEAEGAVAYFVDHVGLKKLAVMYQNDAFGLAVLSGVQLALHRRDLEIVATDTYTRGLTDVERAVESIRQSGADAVIMVGTYSPLAKYIKLTHEAGFYPYFHTVSFVGSRAFGQEILAQKVAPSQYARIIVTQVVPSPFDQDLAGVSEYRRILSKHFPGEEPNYVSLEGFVNAKILSTALQTAGIKLNRSGLIRTFEEMNNIEIGINKPVSYGDVDHTGLEEVFYSRLDQYGTFRVFELTK